MMSLPRFQRNSLDLTKISSHFVECCYIFLPRHTPRSVVVETEQVGKAITEKTHVPLSGAATSSAAAGVSPLAGMAVRRLHIGRRRDGQSRFTSIHARLLEAETRFSQLQSHFRFRGGPRRRSLLHARLVLGFRHQMPQRRARLQLGNRRHRLPRRDCGAARSSTCVVRGSG